MLCVAYLTETRHTGGDSSDNVFIIGQVLVQNHPKIFSGVLRYELSSHEGEAGSIQSGMHLPAAKHHEFSFAWVQQ